MSVNMLVETYECEEVSKETWKMKKVALDLISKLGLGGQATMCGSIDGETIRSPYREMTKEEHDVWKIICPEEYEIEEYKSSPIPLRVLQVIDYAKGLGIYDKLEIWDKVSSTIKDPILVARKGKSWQEDFQTFILARWGEELDEWPAMLNKAGRMAKEKLLSAIGALKRESTRRLVDLKDTPERDCISIRIPYSTYL